MITFFIYNNVFYRFWQKIKNFGMINFFPKQPKEIRTTKINFTQDEDGYKVKMVKPDLGNTLAENELYTHVNYKSNAFGRSRCHTFSLMMQTAYFLTV